MSRSEVSWPPLWLGGVVMAVIAAAAFGHLAVAQIPGSGGWWPGVQTALTALSLFLAAHLLQALAALRLTRRARGARPVPKVALDLLRLALFAGATLISLSLFFRQDLSGLLAGAGMVLAVLGFAIRNVVADTFSGLALGLEAPFRIGDWVNIDGLAQGRVQEIGWRTTRLITRDSTYVILPNSQISRQRITNYSAPRSEYRDHIELTLPADLSVARAKALIREAALQAETIPAARPAQVQVAVYGPAGITYRVNYQVPRHDRETACRNELYSLIDAALREAGIALSRPVVPPQGGDRA